MAIPGTVQLVDATFWSNAIAIVALVVAVIGFVWSRRDAKDTREDADRAVAAAHAAVDAQKDIASRLPAPSVTWSVRSVVGAIHELRNDGRIAAHGVSLDGSSGLFTEDGQPISIHDPWRPGMVTAFFVSEADADSGISKVVVQWRNSADDGDEHIWEQVVS